MRTTIYRILYASEEPECSYQMVNVWRVTLAAVSPPGRDQWLSFCVELDERVTEPDSDPLVLLSAQDGSHRILWRDDLYEAGNYHMLLGDSAPQGGYFFTPYVPLTKTQVILDPASFRPHKGILTRYGKTTILTDLYQTINVSTL